MKNIRVLFYKASKDGKWLDDAISVWTGLWNWGTPPYSHVELQFLDRMGVCFSSATRGKFTGVRFELPEIVLKHRSRWDYIEKAVSDKEEVRLFEAAKDIVGAGYDYWGIFGFLIPWHVQDKKRFYCSESVDYCLHKAGIFPNRHNPVSPRRLSSICAKQFKVGPMPL